VCAQILLIWDCAYDRITQNVIGQLTKKIGPHEIGGLGLGSGAIRVCINLRKHGNIRDSVRVVVCSPSYDSFCSQCQKFWS
jgi:hypothetical protein